MEIESILRELQPFELSYFWQLFFCNVGYGIVYSTPPISMNEEVPMDFRWR